MLKRTKGTIASFNNEYLNYRLILLATVICFFLSGVNSIYNLIIVAISVVMLATKPTNEQSIGKFSVPYSYIIILIIFIATYAYGLFHSSYSQVYPLVHFFTLYFFTLAIFNSDLNFNYYGSFDVIYIIMLIAFLTISISQLLAGQSNVILPLYNDGNFTAFFAFLVFLYANKKKYFSGIIFGIIYALIFTESRSYLFMIALFYLIKLVKNPLERIISKIKIKKTFVLFLIIFFISILITLLWVYVISSSGFTSYHASLNDRSNRIRALSNLNGLQKIIDRNQHLILYGYGDGIYKALGVSAENIYQSRFMGLRLVQPHNSMINLILRMGVIPSILYFLLLSTVLDKFFYKENYAYIFPYLVQSMIIHSLYISPYIIMWLLILAIPNADVQRKYKFIWRKTSY